MIKTLRDCTSARGVLILSSGSASWRHTIKENNRSRGIALVLGHNPSGSKCDGGASNLSTGSFANREGHNDAASTDTAARLSSNKKAMNKKAMRSAGAIFARAEESVEPGAVGSSISRQSQKRKRSAQEMRVFALHSAQIEAPRFWYLFDRYSKC